MKKIIIAGIFLSISWSIHAADITPDPFPPASFTGLYLELDDKGASTSIQLAGDAVIYKTALGDKVLETITVHPSGDDWFDFIQGLNAAKVYKWAPKYYYPGQGASWVIDLAMEDRQFKSEGTNEYPKNGSEADPAADPTAGPSIPFQLFWQAALKLVGKAPTSPPAL